ncbi:hypothetical protein M409DRAFT_65482 [Zasmidium cellare ATCC 36951]|uniref:FAD dependent oxidoreductase domain-containing protein n=1 Tax=Zasmidium cellare ATCC 36951 TaxID=1080233 RepID=A0A6A6CMR5_ZASCE|nr:uncharacterized protein M409DRAFT_65482 [Zasmidium cellare ATCC 36951]KAF2168547.1 hypothetical protein M409DRAFT_65482 [Zasmidium cellare ATCC 36951]
MDPTPKILIIGAGVFGLSTALHLARRGYTSVHLYDVQDYTSTAYQCSQGCVAASCDDNKIIRASYGDSKLYRDLAFEAIAEWEKWNAESGRRLWERCGFLRVGEVLSDGEVRTQENLPGVLRGLQYRVSEAGERRRAAEDGVPKGKIDALGRPERGLVMEGEACCFALSLCREAGVKTHYGPGNGVESLIRTGREVIGIKTSDGLSHSADLVIVACGGWTPSFLPETEDLIETTAGSVVSFRLPRDQEDLWEKYASENFPVWCWNMSSYDREKRNVAGIFGFPRTPEGSHRSEKSGRLISVPETESDKIPEEAMHALKSFCAENMTELLDLEPEQVRLCWYCDSVDESFLIDHVPETEGLMVCSGGSGHGFKFLPVLGKHVVEVVERKDTEYTRLFQWREVPEKKRSLVDDGPVGWQVLEKQRMVDKTEWRA